MSMSTYLIGIKPKDENWHRMRMILELCERGKVQAPAEVLKYFEGAPDRSDDGVLVYLSAQSVGCKEYVSDSKEGFDVDLSKLDPEIKILRFVNSW